jgi:inorganic triphosphatase YgiF
VTVEREIKLAADLDMVLPDLDDLLPGVTVGPGSRLQLSAVYFDTPALSLARWGVTLRARTGEPGPIWTLKVPAPAAETGLSRHELTFDAPHGAVPLAARQAVLAFTRLQPLTPVVRLHTDRTQHKVEIDGRLLATICDDLVVTDGGTEPIDTFREIEVEFAPDVVKHKAIEAVTRRLHVAGCRAAETSVPKAARALGSRAFDPPDVSIPAIGKRADSGVLVRHAIARSVTQLIQQHPGVWISDDPEDLLRFCAVARRLRSDLRTFAPLLDRPWTAWLREELAWLVGEIGTGGDADVLVGRLRSRVAGLPAVDAKAAYRLLERLGETTTEARQNVLGTLSSERYVSLLEALVDAARNPRLTDEALGSADHLDRAILIGLVRKPWRRLSRAVEALAPDDEVALQKVRVRTKRTRYAAEAVAPMCGRDARRFANALAEVQSVLGDYQDTLDAETSIRLAAKALPSARLAAGELIALELDDRERLRQAFAKVWKQASRPKLRRWMA